MKASTQRTLRRLHLYLGMFFAPAIVFFAVSGGIQTFRLTELPEAPAWTHWIASLHKDQAAPEPPRPRPPRPAEARPEQHDDARGAQHDPLALKIFVAVMSLGLALSTGLGIAVALAIPSMRRVSWLMLAAGTVMPVALILI